MRKKFSSYKYFYITNFFTVMKEDEVLDQAETIRNTVPHKVDSDDYVWKGLPYASCYLTDAAESIKELYKENDGDVKNNTVYQSLLGNLVGKGGELNEENLGTLKELVEGEKVFRRSFRNSFESSSAAGGAQVGVRLPLNPKEEERAKVHEIITARNYPERIQELVDFDTEQVYETGLLGDFTMKLAAKERLMKDKEVPEKVKENDVQYLQDRFEKLRDLDIVEWTEEASDVAVDISQFDEYEINTGARAFYEENFKDEDLKFLRDLYSAAEEFVEGEDIGPIYEVLENTLMERNEYFTFTQQQPRGIKLSQWKGPEPYDFDEIIGYERQKRELKDFINALQSDSQKMEEILDEENMILLAGPPGTGKTLSFKAFINNLPHHCKSFEIPKTCMDSGLDEVKKIAEKHPQHRYFPLIEDIDITTGKDRDKGPGTYILLKDLESIEGDENNITLLASTNRPERLDPAVIRPGRISTFIDYPPPSREEKGELIGHYEKVYDTEIPRELRDKITDYSSNEDPITPDDVKGIVREYSKTEITRKGEIERDERDEIFDSVVKRQKKVKDKRFRRSFKDDSPEYG